MTLEIPSDIPQWAVVAAAGTAFPSMDEDRMREVQALLLAAAQASERAAAGFGNLQTRLEQAGESQALAAAARSGQEIHQAWGEVTTGLGGLASHVEQAADDGVFTKVVVIAVLSQLVVQVSAAVLFPPGAVAADMMAFAQARVAVRKAIDWLIVRLGGHSWKLVGVAGAVQGALPNLAAQLYQISQGRRDGIDLASLGAGAIAGGVGGLVGHTVGKRLTPVLSRVDERYVAKIPQQWLQKAARGGEILAVIGVAGAAGGVAGVAGVAAASTLLRQEWSRDELSLTNLVTAAGGGVSGSLIGGAAHLFRPTHALAGVDAVGQIPEINGDDPPPADVLAALTRNQQVWEEAVAAQHAAAVASADKAEPAPSAATEVIGPGGRTTAGTVPAAAPAGAGAGAGTERAPVTKTGVRHLADDGMPVGGRTPSRHDETGAASRDAPHDLPVSAPHTGVVAPALGDIAPHITAAEALVRTRVAEVTGDRVHAHGTARAGGIDSTVRPSGIDSTAGASGIAAAAIYSEAARAVVAPPTDAPPTKPGTTAAVGAAPGGDPAAISVRTPAMPDPQDAPRARSDTVHPSDQAPDSPRFATSPAASAPADGDGQIHTVDHGAAEQRIDVEGLNGNELTATQARLMAAAEEILDEYHARSSDHVPKTMRLNDVPDEVLEFGLLHADEHDSFLAAIETVRRRTGKLLYREQLMGVLAMREGLIPEMAPGSGKTLTVAVHNVWSAVHRGPTLLVTSSDPLAYEALAENQAIFSGSGVNFVRVDPDQPVPAPEQGKPTVYIATQDALGFAELRGHLEQVTFTTATIDEIDAALFYMKPTYVLSDGAVSPASKAAARAIIQARDFVDNALATTTLTEADFGRDPALPRSPARLTAEGSARAQQLWQGRLTGDDVQRINAAAAVALRDFVEGDHYVMHEGRPVIIDPVSHKVMRDPRTATESRWHDIAPAIEAAAAKRYDAAGTGHDIVIHGNSETSKSATLGEVLQRRVQSLTGTSGTVMNVAETISKVYGTGAAVEIPRTKEHRMEHGGTIVAGNQDEKRAALVDNMVDIFRNEGLPQLALTHRNSDVAAIAVDLRTRVPDATIHVVDAKWILDQGVHWEDRLHDIVENAGKPGRFTIINMQGGRGNDYKVHDTVSEAGGMVAHLFGRSAISEDVDIQARNRVARNGQRGRAYEYVSVDDALFDRPDYPAAQLVITQYRAVAAAYRDNPGEHRAALDHAANAVLELVPVLQLQSLHRLEAQFLPTNTAALIQQLSPPGPWTLGPVQATATPESATGTDQDPGQTRESSTLGHSVGTQPLRPDAPHTAEPARHAPGTPETNATGVDVRAPLDQPKATTAQLLHAALNEVATLNGQVLQPGPVWQDNPLQYLARSNRPDGVDSAAANPPDAIQDARGTGTGTGAVGMTSDQPASDSHQRDRTVLPTPGGHLPQRATTGAIGRRPADIQAATGPTPLTPWSHPTTSPWSGRPAAVTPATPAQASVTPMTPPQRNREARTPWSRSDGFASIAPSRPPWRVVKPGTSQAIPITTELDNQPVEHQKPGTTVENHQRSAPPVEVTPVDRSPLPGFDVAALVERHQVTVALWQAQQARDTAKITELQPVAEAFDQAGTSELVRLLDAATTDGAIRRQTPSRLNDLACALEAALRLRDLQAALGNPWDNGKVPRVLPGERHISPVAWSYLLGGHGEDLPGGVAGHRQVENFLGGLGDDEPGPPSAEQRAAHHGRVAVVMDKEGPDSAHTYFVVNWQGTLLVVAPDRFERPVLFDPRRAESVLAVRVVKLAADGTPVVPIVTELSDGPVEHQKPGTTVKDDRKSLPRPDISHRYSMPDVSGSVDSAPSSSTGLPGSALASTSDDMWRQHSGAVRAVVAHRYSDYALIDALVDEVRVLARNRMSLRDNSTDPTRWLTDLASGVANEPVGWADRTRRGLVAALPDSERPVLEPILADAHAAMLAHAVNSLGSGRREVVDLLCRQPKSLQRNGFDDNVVRDVVRAVAGAIAGVEMIAPWLEGVEYRWAPADRTPAEYDVLRRVRTGATISESERPVLVNAVANVRKRLRANAALLQRAETYLLGPSERRVEHESATVSVPVEWLPAWFPESGVTGVVPDGPAAAVVSALRSAVRALVLDEADYLRMRIAGLSVCEVGEVMGLSPWQASELHNTVMAKVATLLVRAAVTSDPDLLRRGITLWGYQNDRLLVEHIISGENELPAELERYWEQRPVDVFHAVVSSLGEVCLAEWAPVVAVARGVGPATATALRAVSARSNHPVQVKWLRWILWGANKELTPPGSDIDWTNLVNKVFTDGQQTMLRSAMRAEYPLPLRLGPALMELPRVAGAGDVAEGTRGRTSETSAPSRPVLSGTVRNSGYGNIPWSDRAAKSLPDPDPPTPTQSGRAKEAAAALVAGAAWESLSRIQIDALVRANPQDVLATDAPWPVRHAAAMMQLVRDRADIWKGPQHELTVDAEQEAARAELVALAVRSRRVSETIAALAALQVQVAELGDQWRAWLVSYDPQTGAAVMAVTNSHGAHLDSVVGHVVSEGPTLRNQFARAVGHLIGDARKADGNMPFGALALIGDRVGEDPFHNAMAGLPAGTVHVVVHGVPEDADLPWDEHVAVAPAYLDQLRAAVIRHRWVEPDDPALGSVLNTVASVADYMGSTGSELWTVSGEQRMGHRALTIRSGGEPAAVVELLVENHPDPVRGPAANDPGPRVTVALPLYAGRRVQATAAIATLANGQSARSSLQESLEDLLTVHRAPHVRVQVSRVGGEQRVHVTVPGTAEAVSVREPVAGDGATRSIQGPHQLIAEFASASGLDATMVRFYWPVLPMLERLIRGMSDVPVREPITAELITDFAHRVAQTHGDTAPGPQTVLHMLESMTEAHSYGLLERDAGRAAHVFELGAVMHLTRLYTEENEVPGTLWNLVPTVPDCQDPREVLKRYWLAYHENNSRYWVDGAAVERNPVTLDQIRSWAERSRSGILAGFDGWDTPEYVERNYGEVLEDDVKILRGLFRIFKSLGIRLGSMNTAVDLGGGSNLYPAMMLHLMLRKTGAVARVVYKGNQPELRYNWVLTDPDGDGLLSDTAPTRGPKKVATHPVWFPWTKVVVDAAGQSFSDVSDVRLLHRALGSTVVPGDVLAFSPLGELSPLGLMSAPQFDIASDFYAIDSVFTTLGGYFSALLCEINAADQVLVSGWTINNGLGYASGTSWYANTRYNKAEREWFLRNVPRVTSFETVEHKAPASFSENDEGLAVNVAKMEPPAPDPEVAELDDLRRHLLELVDQAVSDDRRERLLAESRSSQEIGPRTQQVMQQIRDAELARAGLPVDSLGKLTAQLLEGTAATITRLQDAGVPAPLLTDIDNAVKEYHDASTRVFDQRRARMRAELLRQSDKVEQVLLGMGQLPAPASQLTDELLDGAEQLNPDVQPDPDRTYDRLREAGVPQSEIDELSGAVAYYLGLAGLLALAEAQSAAFDEHRQNEAGRR